MFVPSGTMGNQVAIMTHTRRGDEVICSENAHIVIHEVGATAVLSGVCLRTVKSDDDRADGRSGGAGGKAGRYPYAPDRPGRDGKRSFPTAG